MGRSIITIVFCGTLPADGWGGLEAGNRGKLPKRQFGKRKGCDAESSQRGSRNDFILARKPVSVTSARDEAPACLPW